MKVRLHGKQLTSKVVSAAGQDLVLAATPLPPGAVINGVRGSVHRISGLQLVGKAAFYGYHGFVIPMPDPDTTMDLNTMWDRYVKKDAPLSAAAFDLDEATGVDDPVAEIGEVQIEQLMGFGAGPKRVYERFRMQTAANGMAGYDRTANNYYGTEIFRVNITKRYRVKVASYLMFAGSVPDTLNTNTTFMTVDTEKRWYLLRWMEQTLENARLSLAGLTEAGATTPYIESLVVLEEYLDRVIEGTAGDFEDIDQTFFSKLTADITFPGMPSGYKGG